MKFQMIFFLMCGIEISSQLTGHVCVNEGPEYCCANSENINGICTKCRKGWESDVGGRCVSCKNNTYGDKCINKCVCDQFQRCDPEVGCVPQTSIPTIHTSYTGTIGPILLPTDRATAKEATGIMNGTVSPQNDRATAKEATVIRNGTIGPVSAPNDIATAKEATVIRNGTSTTEWIIYTLCITGCFILTVLCHLFRKYRKRQALGFRIINEEGILKPLEQTIYNDDIYDEIDDNPLTFVTTGANVTPQTSQNETINFVFNERQSNTTGNEDDEVGYLDIYFAMKEDENHQVGDRALQNKSLSTSSSKSNVVVQDNTEYHKPYIPLQQYCKEESHACEVAVTVHQCIELSSGSDEDGTMKIYSNVFTPLQKDRQMNSQANENERLQTALPSVYRTGYFQDHLNKYKYSASDNKIADCGEIESFKDEIFENKMPKTL